MNTSSAEITASRASVPYAKSTVANTVLTASARSAADAQASTTDTVSVLGVKRRAGSTIVIVSAPYVRCVASTQNRPKSMSEMANLNQSEMALKSEPMPQCARKSLDTADIVRDGDVSTSLTTSAMSSLTTSAMSSLTTSAMSMGRGTYFCNSGAHLSRQRVCTGWFDRADLSSMILYPTA